MLKLAFWVVFIAAIAVITMTQWFASARDRQVQAQFPALGEMVDVDGVRIHTVVLGEGPDVVLIHGASGNLREFTFDFAHRLAKTHRVFVVDRPGLGHSDLAGPDFGKVFSQKSASINLQGDLIRRAVEKLGADKPIVVGHSYGGAVGLAWAVDHPDALSGLVLLGAASNPWETDLGLYYNVNGSFIGGAFMPPILAAFVPKTKVLRTIEEIFTPQVAPPKYAEYVGADLVLTRKAIRANARQVSNLLSEIKALSPQYSQIKVPTLIYHGDLDTIVPLEIHSRPLATQVPQSQLFEMKGVGHMPHHADPEVILKGIRSLKSL